MTLAVVFTVHNLLLLYLIYSFILSDGSLKVFELESPVLNEDLYERPNVSLREMGQASVCD